MLLPVLIAASTPFLARADDTAPIATAPEMSTPTTSVSSSVGQITLPNLPSEIRFGDLSKNWRRFTLDSKDARNSYRYNPYGYDGGGQLNWAYESVLRDLGVGVHFTKGENLIIGKETYLIAYRVDPGLEPQELQQEIQSRIQESYSYGGRGGRSATSRPAGKFSPRATLKLALLNLRDAGDLKDLRAFDPKRDLLSAADLRQISNENLKRLGQFLRQFQLNNWSANQGLPLRDMRALRTMMQNYFRIGARITRDPATNEAYHLNTTLGGKHPDRIGNKKAIAAIYEGAPSTDGTRGVLFLDGHVERLADWKWKAVRDAKIEGPSPREWRGLSNKQLKTIGQYVLNFAQYSRGVLPPTASDFAAQRAMMRYFGWNKNLYRQPETRKSYHFNKAISRVNLKAVINRKDVVAAYESSASGDGTIGAVFLSGKVYRIKSSDWPRVLGVRPKLNPALKQTHVGFRINNRKS